jgi:hypothetical protein
MTEMQIMVDCKSEPSHKKVSKYKSPVLKFFLEVDDEAALDYDNAVNALALICALVLTVPFGVMGMTNSEYFENLEVTLDACTNSGAVTYEAQFSKYLSNLGLTIYTCLMGLTFSCGYYLFYNKEQSSELSHFQRLKLKILMFCLFLATVGAVTGLMNLSSLLLNYYTVPFDKLCTYNNSDIWGTGIFFVFLSFFSALFLMW